MTLQVPSEPKIARRPWPRYVLAGAVLAALWAIRAGDTPLEDAIRLVIVSVCVAALTLIVERIRLHYTAARLMSDGFVLRAALAHIVLALTAAGVAALLELTLATRSADYIVAGGLFVVVAMVGPRLHCRLMTGHSEAEMMS